MTKPLDPKSIVTKIVVFFDLCSSTSILEDLLASENEDAWCALLLELKEFIRVRKVSDEFEMYKFLGDGWILLFEPNKRGEDLMLLLAGIAKEYERLHQEHIHNRLSTEIGNTGLTFGIDRGKLMKVTMNRSTEYIGRSLNVASRLQSSIKEKDSSPQGKVLMTRAAFNDIGLKADTGYKIDDVTRKLRNISGNSELKLKKISLFRSPAIRKSTIQLKTTKKMSPTRQ